MQTACALWRRWDLVDRLADKVDAYVIPGSPGLRAATHVDGATSHVCTASSEPTPHERGAGRGRGSGPRGACDRAGRRLTRPDPAAAVATMRLLERARQPAWIVLRRRTSCAPESCRFVPASPQPLPPETEARQRAAFSSRRASRESAGPRRPARGSGRAWISRRRAHRPGARRRSRSPGHDLDDADLLFPLLEQPRRQTGGVRERPQGTQYSMRMWWRSVTSASSHKRMAA